MIRIGDYLGRTVPPRPVRGVGDYLGRVSLTRRERAAVAALLEADDMPFDAPMPEGAEPPTGDAPDGDHEEALRSGFEASCLAVVKDSLAGNVEPKEALKKLAAMLKAHAGLSDKGGDDGEPTKEADEEDEPAIDRANPANDDQDDDGTQPPEKDQVPDDDEDEEKPVKEGVGPNGEDSRYMRLEDRPGKQAGNAFLRATAYRSTGNAKAADRESEDARMYARMHAAKERSGQEMRTTFGKGASGVKEGRKAAKESDGTLLARIAELEAREECRALCESMGVRPGPSLLDALVRTAPEGRKALLEETAGAAKASGRKAVSQRPGLPASGTPGSGDTRSIRDGKAFAAALLESEDD